MCHFRRKQVEVESLEQSIRQRSEQQKKAGVELDATCQICLKTRFADGIGHVCHYCNIRCCARCGGKVTLRSTKVIWVCILCRKKQELLSKTGQWINKSTSPEGFIRHGGSDTRTTLLNPHDTTDKRPKLERARSAAEKENQPLQRTGSLLRRQYSQQETSTQRRASASASDSGVDDSYIQRSHLHSQHQQGITGSNVDGPYINQSPLYRNTSSSYYPTSTSYPLEDDPRYYQGEIEGLMRTHPHLVHPRQQGYISQQQQQQQQQSSYMKQQKTTQDMQHHYGMQDPYGKKRPLVSGSYLPQQRSYSSSEEDIRSTPEFEAWKYFDGSSTSKATSTSIRNYRSSSPTSSSNISGLAKAQPIASTIVAPSKLDIHQRNQYNRVNHSSHIYNNNNNNRIGSSYYHNNTLPSSHINDQSLHNADDLATYHHHQYNLASSPTKSSSSSYNNYNYNNRTSAILNQSNSGSSSYSYYSNSRYLSDSLDPYVDEQVAGDSRRFTERRKKTVRFDGQDSNEFLRWESERQESQDSTTKDSGIDTSSTFTSSEDSNRGDGPKNPVSWQVSADAQRMIGHMLLRKNIDGEDILGLKIVGGKPLSSTRKGAIIEKVKRGSIAEQEGHLRVGDEVIEWNGRSLQGKSAQEVYDVIEESRHESQIELIVSRPLSVNRKAAQTSWRQSHSPIRQTRQYLHKESFDVRDKPSVLVTSPGSPDFNYQQKLQSSVHSKRPLGRYQRRLMQSGSVDPDPNIGGRTQIKLGFESGSLQLIVTIVCAADLTYRPNGAARNPYAKIFLLPCHSDKSKRRTKTLASTNEPRWGQTFTFTGLRRADLTNRLLEITLWDYVRYDVHEFLGEVVIDLHNHPLDDEPEWYMLQPHQEEYPGAYHKSDDHHLHHHHSTGHEIDIVTPTTDHLSPPSTTSRLSDSDTSECDIDGLTTGRDGASISSLGSSSSPPPEVDLIERRSRRDMSPQGRKRVAGMVSRDYQTVSGIGGTQSNFPQSQLQRRGEPISMSHRSQSAAPSDYRSDRRGSLSPPDDRYITGTKDYPVLPLNQQQQSFTPKFQSRSATATPTGSPKKRQLPKVPQISRNPAIRDRLMQDFEERSMGRRHRGVRPAHHIPQYRSTAAGGWERHYSGLSDSDLTNAETRLRPRASLSPDKDFGDFGDSDMESVVSVTSSAFSTQSERPRGSKGLRNVYKRRSLQRSLPNSWFRDEIFTERESEFLKSINMDESIPQSSAVISNIPINIPNALKSVYRSSSLVSSSLPERYNKRFSSYDFPMHSASSSSQQRKALIGHSLNDLRNRFRSRSSEPNLINNYEIPTNQTQTIVISNQSGNKSNQIILKSSFSDQNLTTNINADKMKFNCSVKYSDKEPQIAVIQPLPFPIEGPSPFYECNDVSIISSSSSSSRSVRRRLPKTPNITRNTQSLYLPSFPRIPSMDLDNSPISPRFGKSLSADAPTNEINENLCDLSQDYLKSDNEEGNELRRSYSLIADEQIIDVEYDSDTGWMTKNVRKSPFKKIDTPPIIESKPRERSYSRENLKLDLKFENKPKTPVESIGSIINDVRTQLLLSESDDKKIDLSSLKVELEGKVVSPKILLTEKYISEKTIDFENKITLNDEASASNESPNVFEKCRSRTLSDDTSKTVSENDDDDEEVFEDVFATPHKRERNASFSGKTKANLSNKHERSSSLENVPTKSNIRKNSSGKSTRNSSVSINENPEYFEYTIPTKSTKSSKIASSHAIAKLNTKPKRGSLKKSSTSKSPKKHTASTSSRSSDYERGRSRNVEGSHRESFKKNDRTNERSSEQDASDREHKDGNLNRSLSNTDTNIEDRIDGSLSDTAVGLTGLDSRRGKQMDQRSPKSETSTQDRYGAGGMGKKSNSTSQLSATDQGVTTQRKRSSAGSIQRSIEVVPTRAGSLHSISSSEGSSWSPSLRMVVGEGGQLSEFIDGLGPGQLVGRQVLGAPALGDIQLSLCYQKGFLEVEVIRARGLQARSGSKVLPAPYVKVYLVSGKKCIAKAKTTAARKTLDPLYQQMLAFREPFQGCVLQVTVWGDYGRIEGKKVFMGVAQIMLDNLNLSHIVIGWYKLFGTTSLVPSHSNIGLGSRRSSIASLDSLKL
ncbi:hypothetical protein PVAND_002613 [Polypedilum vanderplanki]|uniref:Uncharacterized protein n=1 Tax=Polypedilum vanderplanki TaxID=319348 RepID=A0A9J6BRP7_POLVA|nr:hypothetical protein PVAND_002613 [Polypedilum vanderplanki]